MTEENAEEAETDRDATAEDPACFRMLRVFRGQVIHGAPGSHVVAAMKRSVCTPSL